MSDSGNLMNHEPLRAIAGWQRECLYRLMTPAVFPAQAAPEPLTAVTAAEPTPARDVRHATGEVERLQHALTASRRKARRIAWASALGGAAVILALLGVRELPAWIDRAGEPVRRVGQGFRGTFAVPIGERIPEFRGYILYPDGPDGRAMTQHDWLGRRVVLLVWHAGDEASLAALRSLSEIFESGMLADAPDTILLGLCLEENHAGAVAAVEAAGAAGWEHLWDRDPRSSSGERVSVRMKVNAVPGIYIFDQLTRLQYMGIDPDSVGPALQVLRGGK